MKGVTIITFINFLIGFGLCEENCAFPPKPLGGDFKVIKLLPLKTIRYFCHPGFHLWGEEIAICDPKIGWQDLKVECLVDVANHKLALSSNSLKADLPLQGKWHTKNCFKTSTGQDKSSWWTLDLLESIEIKVINITFAKDESIPKSIEIRVGNSTDFKSNPLCGWLTNAKPFELVECSSVTRYVTISTISDIPLVLCAINVLSSKIQSKSQCPNGDSTLIFDDICYWRTFQKLNFNGSLDLCHNYGMDLLTNQYPGYTKIVELENVDGKIGRKVLWIGAQMRLRNQWFWVQNRTLEWPWNGVEVESQPWGLQEPSGDDCVVADSALQWQWNSLRCVISAFAVCESQMEFCPSPDSNPGSFISSMTKILYEVGDELSFECSPGYALVGPKNRICQSNGKWSEEAPKCQYVKCEESIILSQGEESIKESNTSSYGSTQVISCQEGYISSKSFKTYTCGLSGWTSQDDDFQCMPIQDNAIDDSIEETNLNSQNSESRVESSMTMLILMIIPVMMK